MEKNGVYLDLDFLSELSSEFNNELGRLQKKIYAISENRCAGCYETVEFVWNRDEVNKKRIELELKYDMSFMITTFKSELDDVIPTPSLYVLMCGYSGIGGLGQAHRSESSS